MELTENGRIAEVRSRARSDAREQHLTIKPPNFKIAEFRIMGTAPYVGNKFSARARADMRAKQEKGSVGDKERGRKRSPKDFERSYKEAIHCTNGGWAGIPAPAFRNAMISACKVVGFQMTRAKLAVFVLADGVDKDDGTPLVRIIKGKPHYAEHAVRNESGVVDIRPRPMWDEGWEAVVRVRFDADQFAVMDIANLLSRAGMQVGIGAGRPDSKDSNGMGWGLFSVGDGKRKSSRSER